MSRNKGAPATPAMAALLGAGVHYVLHSYENEAGAHHRGKPAFADEAAAALGLAPERLFKTLIVQSEEATPGLAVALVAASGQLDLRALASVLQAKRLRLAPAETAARSTGYIVGGISPVGQRHPLPGVIDESARAFETVFVSAGRRGLQLELNPHDLCTVMGARWGAITR